VSIALVSLKTMRYSSPLVVKTEINPPATRIATVPPPSWDANKETR